MGISVRILFSALHSLGMMIAMHMGLASGSMFDPAQQSQGSEIGVLLSLTALAAAFAMDLHHAWLRGVVSSYAVFVPGEILPIADWSEFISQKTQESFALALQLSVPNLIVGFLIALVGGILARLMPQLNIFFISLPVQIAGGLITLIMFVSSMMLWFLARAEESALMWLPGGGM
jgi:flagellar biosynthetic protein FliR